MKDQVTTARLRSLFVACSAAAVASCGGGGSDAPAPPPPPPPPPAALSAAQTAFEGAALAVNGGLHDMLWTFPATGTPASASGDFIVDISSGGLAASPLASGVQAESLAWATLASTLAVPTVPISISVPSGSPTRSSTTGPTKGYPGYVVKNGAVLRVATSPPAAEQRVSYVGDNIQVDTFATDGTTVAFSTMITAVAAVSVAGQRVAAPTDSTIAGWLNKYNLVSNASLLKADVTFGAGSQYLLLTATRKGDTLSAGDCTWTGPSLSASALIPCQVGRTLGGTSQTTEGSYSDGTSGVGKLWNLATEGTICEIAAQAVGTVCPPFGVRYWVAAVPRAANVNVPREVQSYRIYYELNGNIYDGNLQRDGAPIGQNIGSDVSPNMLTSFIRVNKAFVQSVQAALNFGSPGGPGTVPTTCVPADVLAAGTVIESTLATTFNGVPGNPISGTLRVVGASTFQGQPAFETSIPVVSFLPGTVRAFTNYDPSSRELTVLGAITHLATADGSIIQDTTSVARQPARYPLYTLSAGQSATATVTSDSTTVSTTNGVVGAPVLQTKTSTTVYTYLGQETLTTPAGTFGTCKFTQQADGGAVSTTWLMVGYGPTVKFVSGATVETLTSVSVNGTRLTQFP